MNKLEINILVFVILGNFAFGEGFEGENTKNLTIRWQRLVDEKGQTCERCGLNTCIKDLDREGLLRAEL